MIANVNAEQLREAVGKILTVVDKKNTTPILTYSLVNVSSDHLEISATDLEVSARVILDAEVSQLGHFCINAKNFFDILKELPNEVISLEINENENNLKIYCKDIQFNLLVYKSDDYPQLLFENKQNNFNIESNKILEIINKTANSISTDETRLYLNGIYLQEIDSKLRAVSTDGQRLSMFDTELYDAQNETLINGIIIPRKGVYELKKIAETFPDKLLTISVDDSFIYISSDDKYFLSVRLIAREYPKYQAVIPNKTSYTITTDKDKFLDAIRRIKIMSSEKSNGVRINLNESEMTIMANHPSLGDAREKIDINYMGKSMEIGLNAKFLMDTLSVFHEGDISLELNNELTPIILKSETEPNYLGVIMPLKL